MNRNDFADAPIGCSWRNIATLAVVTICCPFVFSACESAQHSRQRKAVSSDQIMRQSRRDEFTEGIEFLHRIGEFDPRMAHQQVLLRLNQWIGRQVFGDQWAVDPMYERLPKKMDQVKREVGVEALHFTDLDVFYLQEQMFLKDVARSSLARPFHDPMHTGWLGEMSSVIGEDAASQLATAQRLFDWTVRNVQLKEMPSLARRPKGVVGPKQAKEDSPPELPDKQKNIPGPGERFLTWESLLAGRGDAIDRARIFILLLRQVGIPAVMLALEDDQFIEPRPWLPAALIAGKLYLFDMQLGLPVFGPGEGGIASLEQVIADPSLLRSLDVEPEHLYPVSDRDLGRVVAWIDAAPRALSRRMQIVQNQLTGESRMDLFVSPSQLAEQLQKCDGVKKIQIWELPFEQHRLRQNWADDKVAAAVVEREMFFVAQPFFVSSPNPLMQGRVLQLEGTFDSDGQRKGAKQFFMDARPPDLFIRKLSTDSALQRQVNVDKMTPAQLRSSIGLLVTRKQAASYWLGLVFYESGDFQVAVDYFNKLTLEAYPDGPWTAGARFNLARSHEMLGDFQRARQLYEQDPSAQRHGNLLRARILSGLEAEDTGP